MDTRVKLFFERRYGHLLRAMKWVAILSDGEAISALLDYIQGRRGKNYGCEAVHHFGGPEAVVKAAVQARHRMPR